MGFVFKAFLIFSILPLFKIVSGTTMVIIGWAVYVRERVADYRASVWYLKNGYLLIVRG